MDPSYDKSGQDISDVPGVKPGIIASGPDTPEPEVPVLNVGVDPQNPNGIFKKLTRKPTDNRPITPQPMDQIVLDGGGGPQKTKRGLLVAGIALIGVALIAGIVALIVMNSGGDTSVKDAYNNVARYMYFGDVNNETAFSEVTLDNAEYIDVATTGNRETENEFFDNLEQYLNALATAVNSNQTLSEKVANLDDMVVMLRTLSEIAYANTLWPDYLENGKSAIQAYSDKVEAIEMEDESYTSILEMEKILVDKTGELYQIYTNNGCIKNKVADDECVNTVLTENESAKKIQSAMYNLRYNICQYINTLSRTIFATMESLNKEILGE